MQCYALCSTAPSACGIIGPKPPGTRAQVSSATGDRREGGGNSGVISRVCGALREVYRSVSGSGPSSGGTADSSTSIRAGSSPRAVFQTISRLMSKYACTSRWRIPVIRSHGISRKLNRVGSVIRVAASPTISMSLTSASTSWRSLSRSSRVRPCAKDTASRAASSMCRNRIASSLRILDFCRIEDVLAKIAAQILRGAQIHLASTEQR